MKTRPDLSIIIPCHNNSISLEWLLKAISASQQENIEIICVDDQSRDNAIKRLADTFGAKYRRLPEGKPGRRAQARNCGHDLSRGLITLYLDGDIIPEPKLFSYCIKLHRSSPKLAVKYPVYSITDDVQRRYFPMICDWIISNQITSFGPLVTKHVGIDTRPLPKRLRDVPTKLWVLCASHCTSFEKRDVELAGRWDETFTGWGEEDLELAYRLFKVGLRFVYPHRRVAAAYHLDHFVDWESNVVSLRENVIKFKNKHPDAWDGRLGVLKMFISENNLPNSLIGDA